MAIFWQFLRKKWQFSGNFGHLIGNFPEGQIATVFQESLGSLERAVTTIFRKLRWYAYCNDSLFTTMLHFNANSISFNKS